MKNLIKIFSFSVLSILLASGIIFAQEKQAKSNSEKGCSGECCSSKEGAQSIDHKYIMQLESADKNNDGIVYECPMKCEAPKDKTGECSKCGMKLKKVSLADYNGKMKGKSHNMMNHSRMDKVNSKIDLTKLDKNKDGKLYQCPMKCETPQDNPGDCSKCGMHLIETTIEQMNQ